MATCKPHDCYDNSALVLFSIENGVVYGKVLDRQRPLLIGAPVAGHGGGAREALARVRPGR